MKHLIVGTAGHIDHGKTELIKALTGRDTDRLKEEKERGISIDLGFAEYKLGEGLTLGVVDVPGHESFVRNMLAGVSGIDLVLLVVAADEGIMPQTTEHLEILQLLRTRRGIVAITKTDLVDEDWLDLVEEEVREGIEGTFLADSPLIKVSSKTGQGLDEFREALISTASQLDERLEADLFRMPIDRAFTLKGVGTIVTGTIWSGMVKKDENVRILPAGMESRVKNLEVHDQKVDQSSAGCRTALALVGIAKDDLSRGDTLITGPVWDSTRIIDVDLECLKSEARGIVNRRRVRFHCTTQEVMARVVLLDVNLLESGKSTFAQIRLEKPVVVRKGDRFVLRSYSPVRTIGGGCVISPFAKRRTKLDSETWKLFDVMMSGKSEDEVLALAGISGLTGVDRKHLPILTRTTPGDADKITRLLEADKKIQVLGGILFHSAAVVEARERVIKYLEDQHRESPLKTGFALEEMRNKLFDRSPEYLVSAVIDEMIRADTIVLSGGLVRLFSHKISLGETDVKIRDGIMKLYAEGGLSPPTLSRLTSEMKTDEPRFMEILAILKDEDKLIPVTREILFSRAVLDDARDMVRDFLLSKGKATASELKVGLGGSRKYVIPLLEYFDREGLTRREGDYRVLR